MQQFDLVIFDMDGVLVDSYPIFEKADSEILAQAAMDMSKYDKSLTFGMRVEEIANFWVTNFALNLSAEDLVDRINTRVRELIIEEANPKDGVVGLLEYLSSKSISICIASTAPIKTIETVVEALKVKKYFDKMFSSEDCEFGKPHPQVFVNAIEHFGVEPSKTLVIEDSLNGVQAAKSAGAICVAVPEPELRSHLGFQIADYVKKDLNEVSELLRDVT